MANQIRKRVMTWLLGSFVLSATVMTAACNSISPSTGMPMSDVEKAEIEAEQDRVESLKINCRNEDGRSCNVMASDVLSDYENSHNFDDLKSAILLATKACYSDKRYCLTKGDLFYRAYKDGHSIESFMPGRYIREILTEAYEMATESADLSIASDAYYKLGMVNTEFGRTKEAQSNFDMSCKLGNSANCLKGATTLAAAAGKSSTGSKSLMDSAYSSFQKACDLNNTQACISLADRLDADKKYAEADDALHKACSLNDRNACEQLAVRYTKRGKKAEARDAYRKSCDLGNTNSCYVLARAEIRLGDLASAAPLAQKACDGGNSTACFIGGTAYEILGNSEKTLAALRSACSASDSSACYELAIADDSKRSDYLSNACRLGNSSACDALAATYTQSSVDAIGAYQRSCDAGNKDACMQAASAFTASGDTATARRMFSKACDLKSPVACEIVATSSARSGHYESAVKADTLACNANSGNACNRLAMYYSDGLGVKQDLKKAVTYFTKACKAGNKGACYILNGNKD